MAKITLVGAGSVTFAKQLMWDILSFSELADSAIALTDIDPVRLATAHAMAEGLAAQLGGRARVEATLERKKALLDADYVINLVQVGMHSATLLDFQIPKKYGLKQTIADTMDVGGVFRFLRTYPVLVGICRDMEEVCPAATLLNYTNPMGMNMLAVFRSAPGLKAVGLCHSVQGTAKMIARILVVPCAELKYRVAGINHQAFFLELSHRGKDLYPRFHEVLNDPGSADDGEWRTGWWRDMVRIELCRRLGYYVTESPEHNAEYCPWFLQHDELIERFHIPIDDYIRRSEESLKEFEKNRRTIEKGEAFHVELSHEYAGRIIHLLATNTPFSFNGNVLNTGLITNLPQDSCVEVPCLVDRGGIQPTYVGDLPLQCAALNRTNVNVQQLAVEAALTGKKEHVYQAVMLSPNSASVLTLDQIWAMCDELIEAHGDALPKLT